MKQAKIIETRSKLAAHLPSTAEILRGSLLHRHIRHRSGCAVCANSEGHSVWVLTVSYPGGRTKQVSLRPEIGRSKRGKDFELASRAASRCCFAVVG